MQALITKKVADSVIFPAYRGEMLDHIEIREELIRQVSSGRLRQIDVARALSIAPARVAEMRKLAINCHCRQGAARGPEFR